MDFKNLNKTEFLVKSAIVAAIYVVTTVLFPFSYLNIQFRISEILVLLIFLDRRYIYALVVGTLLSNLASPLGLVDIVFGTAATLLTGLFILKTKNLFVATLWPAIVNGLVIGFVLYKFLQLPLLLSIFQVFLGEFVVVSLVGYVLFQRILKDPRLVEKIRFN